jgi:hypothetical protein
MEGSAVFENTIKGRFFAKAVSPDSSILKLSNEDYLKRIAEGKDIYLARARVWVGYDKWTMREAASLLSGLLPSEDHSAKFFHQFCWSETEKDESTNPCRYIVFTIFPRNRECEEHVLEILKRSDIGDLASPRKWAEYAKAKGLLPHTEPFADIDNSPLLSLLEPVRGIVSESLSPIQSAPYITNPWLILQIAAHDRFYNPRRDPDVKKLVVVEWLKSEGKRMGLQVSNNKASVMFGMIKAQDHNPRKKKIEPQ